MVFRFTYFVRCYSSFVFSYVSFSVSLAVSDSFPSNENSSVDASSRTGRAEVRSRITRVFSFQKNLAKVAKKIL